MKKKLNGHKEVAGKLPINLVPLRALESIAKVREFGVKKYSDPWAWLTLVEPNAFIEATRRHIITHLKGNEIDKESGLAHLEHALCSLAMAVEIIKLKEEEQNAIYKK